MLARTTREMPKTTNQKWILRKTAAGDSKYRVTGTVQRVKAENAVILTAEVPAPLDFRKNRATIKRHNSQ